MVMSTEAAARRSEESREEERRKNRACEANSDRVYEEAAHSRCLIHAYFLSQERADRAEKSGEAGGEKGPSRSNEKSVCIG